MKKLCLLIPLGVLFFSCASAPAPVAPAAPSSAKERAVEARDKALSVKADTAAKDDYQAADLVLAAAESMDAGGLDAGSQYQEAEQLFTAAYDSAKSKRDEAQKELDTARSAIKNLETRSAELDRARQGGGR